MILLVNPNLMKPPVAPIALDYLGSALEAAGFLVELLDLAFEEDPIAAIDRRVGGEERLIALTVRNTDDCYFASQDFCLERTRQIVREIKKRTNAPIVAGGIGYSIFPREALDYLEVDAGVFGDGEEVLCQAAACVRDGRDLRETPGTLIPGVRTEEPPHRSRVSDLAEIDLSSRSFVDNPRYLREGAMVGFETKRGCNGACIYCAEPQAKGAHVRVRDPENVARELENLLRQGVNTFHTCDSEFNLFPEHAIGVCEAIVRRGLADRIRWYAYATPHPFPSELAVAMKRAGCVGVNFGVDHADDDMLARLGRRHRAEHLRETAARCHREGIVTMYDLLLGGPGETRDSIARTIGALKAMEPDRVGVSFGVRVYPNTPLGRQLHREGVTPENPNLRGAVENNDSFMHPIFYVSSALGEEIGSFLQEQITGDERFFVASTEPSAQNYNYNDNSVLTDAIAAGERGAFWDILRRREAVD